MSVDTRTRICQECGLAAYWHATAYERKGDPNACNTLRSAVVAECEAPGDQEHDHAMCEDSVAEREELAQSLYPIFVALVDWCVKRGSTHVNATRAAHKALSAIGVHYPVRALIGRRYLAGVRATADLHREGKL